MGKKFLIAQENAISVKEENKCDPWNMGIVKCANRGGYYHL